MDLKIYRSESLQSAMQKIRQDLGPDAIILSSRTRVIDKNGEQQCIYEVTALPSTKTTHSAKLTPTVKPAQFPVIPDPSEEFIRVSQSSSHRPPKETQSKTFTAHLDEIHETLQSLSSDLESLRQTIRQWHHTLQMPRVSLEGAWIRQLFWDLYQIQNLQEMPFLAELQAKGTWTEVCAALKLELQKTSQWSIQSLQNLLVDCIHDLPHYEEELLCSEEPRVLMFHGPAGGGKSTFIAKILTRYLKGPLKTQVALGVFNRVKVAAQEPLSSFSKILGIPFFVFQTIEDLWEEVRHPRKWSLLLVEHPCSQQDPVLFAEWKKVFEPQIEHHLVWNASWHEHYALKAWQNYANGPHFKSLSYTKLDDMDLPGSIFSLAFWSQIPLLYLNYGRRLEDLLKIAKRDEIVQLLLENHSLRED